MLFGTFIRILTSLIRDFCTSDRNFASTFFQIPSHDGHPWSWLVFATMITTPTTDFHCLDICHARHTKKEDVHLPFISQLQQSIHKDPQLYPIEYLLMYHITFVLIHPF